MFIARGIQNAASARLYKSILKPLLGPYLEEELDVDQLDIHLSKGEIKLNSLNIKADALNNALLGMSGGSTGHDAGGTDPSTNTPSQYADGPNGKSLPFMPFVVERCTIDEISLEFSSLGAIAEEGIDVEADGITIDILPSTNFQDELREIMRKQIFNQKAEAAARRANQFAAAAASAGRAAMRAAAAADGLPVPQSLRTKSSLDSYDQASANDEPSVDPSPSSSSFVSSLLGYLGLHQNDSWDGDTYSEDPEGYKDLYDDEHQSSQVSEMIIDDDELAEKGVGSIRRLWEQIASNIRANATDIRFRFRISSCKDGEPDSFLEVVVPSIAFSDDTNHDEDIGVARKVVSFPEISVSLVQGRDPCFTPLASSSGDKEKDPGVETLLFQIGENSLSRHSDRSDSKMEQSCRVTIFMPKARAVHDDTDVIVSDDGAKESPLHADIHLSSFKCVVPDGNTIVSELVSIFSAYMEDPMVFPEDDELNRSIRNPVDDSSQHEVSKASELLGVSLTQSQMLEFYSTGSKEAHSGEESSKESSAEESDDFSDDDDDDFEDCIAPPMHMSQDQHAPLSRKISHPTSSKAKSVLTIVCVNFCVSVRSDLPLEGFFPNYTPVHEKKNNEPYQNCERHMCARADTIELELSVGDRAPKDIHFSSKFSNPRIETYNLQSHGSRMKNEVVDQFCLLEVITGGSESESSSSRNGAGIPSVISMNYEKFGGSQQLGFCIGDSHGNARICVNAGVEELIRWSGCFDRLARCFHQSLSRHATRKTKNEAMNRDARQQKKSALCITISSPGLINVCIDASADFSSAIMFEVEAATLSIHPSNMEEKCSHMRMYDLPLHVPGVLFHTKRVFISFQTSIERKYPSLGKKIESVDWFVKLAGVDVPVSSVTSEDTSIGYGAGLKKFHPIWFHMFTRSGPSCHPGIHPDSSDTGYSQSETATAKCDVPISPQHTFRVDESEGYYEQRGKRRDMPASNRKPNNNQESGTTKSECISAENAMLRECKSSIVVSVPEANVRLTEEDLAELLGVISCIEMAVTRELKLQSIQIGSNVSNNNSSVAETQDDSDTETDSIDDILDDTVPFFGGLCKRGEDENNVTAEVSSALAVSIRSLVLDLFENANDTQDQNEAEDYCVGEGSGMRGFNSELIKNAKLRGYYRKILDLRSRQKVPFRFRIEASHFQLVQGSWRPQLCSTKSAMNPKEYRRLSCADLLLMEGDARCKNSDGDFLCPILYSNKWGGLPKPARLPAFGGLDHGCMIWFTTKSSSNIRDYLKDVLMDIEFFGTILRYNVYSSWIFRLMDIIFEPKVSNTCVHVNQKHEKHEKKNLVGKKQLNVLTQLQVTLHDCLVDYEPQQYIPLNSAGRMLLTLGQLRVSTNILSENSDTSQKMESVLTIFIEDAAMFLAGRHLPYEGKTEASCSFFDNAHEGSKAFHVYNGYHSKYKSLAPTLKASRLTAWDIEHILLTAHFALIGRLDHVKLNITTVPRQTRSKSDAIGYPNFSEGDTHVNTQVRPLSVIEMDVGTVSLFCCADSCAAFIDMISALSDEISLTDAFLESRSRIIPRRFVRRDDSLKEEAPLNNEQHSTTPSKNVSHGSSSQIDRSSFDRKHEVKSQKSTENKIGILSSINPHAFGQMTTSCSGIQDEDDGLDLGEVASQAQPIVIEDYYTAGGSLNASESAHWLRDTDSPVLLDNSSNTLFESISSKSESPITETSADPSYDFIYTRNNTLSVEASAPPIYSQVTPSAPPFSMDNLQENPVVRAVLTAENEVGSIDSCESSDDEASSTIYYSTLGYDGWWNDYDPTKSQNHLDDPTGMSGNAVELKTHVLHGQNANMQFKHTSAAFMQEEQAGDLNTEALDEQSLNSSLQASITFHKASSPERHVNDFAVSGGEVATETSKSCAESMTSFKFATSENNIASEASSNDLETLPKTEVVYADILFDNSAGDFGLDTAFNPEETKQVSKSLILTLNDDAQECDVSNQIFCNGESISPKLQKINLQSPTPAQHECDDDDKDKDGVLLENNMQNQIGDSLPFNAEYPNEEMAVPEKGLDGEWYGGPNSMIRVYDHYVAVPITGLDTEGGNMMHHLEGFESSLFANQRDFEIKDKKQTLREMKFVHPQDPEKRFIITNADVRVRIYGGQDFPCRDLPPRFKIEPRAENRTKRTTPLSLGNPNRTININREGVVSMKSKSNRADRRQMLLGTLLEEFHQDAAPFKAREDLDTMSWWEIDRPDIHKSSSSIFTSQAKHGRRQRTKRRTDQVIEFHLASISMQNTSFFSPLNSVGIKNSGVSCGSLASQYLTSAMLVVVRDVEINDHVRASGIRKMLSHWESKDLHPRESGSAMLKLQMNTVRDCDANLEIAGTNITQPLPESQTSQAKSSSDPGMLDSNLDISLLPLRINMDQDTMDVLISFGVDVAVLLEAEVDSEEEDNDDKLDNSSAGMSPFLPMPNDEKKSQPGTNGDTKAIGSQSVGEYVSADVLFFRSFVLGQVKAKIDYVSKRVDIADLRSGNYAQLINITPIEGVRLEFPKVRRASLCGIGEVCVEIGNAWANAFTNEQIYRCAAGVTMPPLDSLANLAEGAANVILMPLEEYQRFDSAKSSTHTKKNGKNLKRRKVDLESTRGGRTANSKTSDRNKRVFQKIRTGVSSFARALAYESAANVSRFATSAHGLVSGAEDILLNTSSTSERKRSKSQKGSSLTGVHKKKRQYYKPVLSDQPSGPIEGMKQAAEGVARRAKKVARTLVMLPVASFQSEGIGGAIKSGVRAVPVAIIEPVAMLTETVSRVTLGVRNWVDPEKREDDQKKWKRRGVDT